MEKQVKKQNKTIENLNKELTKAQEKIAVLVSEKEVAKEEKKKYLNVVESLQELLQFKNSK